MSNFSTKQLKGILVLWIILSLSSALGIRPLTGPIFGPPERTTGLSYVVVIIMENKNYEDIIGNSVSAPYINRLVHDYSLATNYSDVSFNFSLPNYLGLIAGSTYSRWSACNVPPYACSNWTGVKNQTLIDRLNQAGLSWKAYMDSMPLDCYPYDSGLYAARHNPFVYLDSVLNDTSNCERVVPSGNGASAMISDLGATATASNFMWLTPNLCEDMHDCPTASGDTYLSTVIPEILNSNIFTTQNAALFVTWDEGWGSNSSHVPAIWAGPAIRNNYTSTISHNHYSLLKTLEAVWHLPALTPNDASASAMTEFFKGPETRFAYSPSQPRTNQTITFWATTTGGASPFFYTWNFGDGETATGVSPTHDYETSGSYKVTVTVVDRLNNTGLTSGTLDLLESSAVLPHNGAGLTLPAWLLGIIPLSIIATSAIITFIAGISLVRRPNQNVRWKKRRLSRVKCRS